MIVVDTTVWIDFFNGRDEPHVHQLTTMIEADVGIAVTDVTLTEVLQGIRDESQVLVVDERLTAFDVLRLESLDDFRRAAQLYRTARRQRGDHPTDHRLPHRLRVHPGASPDHAQ